MDAKEAIQIGREKTQGEYDWEEQEKLWWCDLRWKPPSFDVEHKESINSMKCEKNDEKVSLLTKDDNI